MRRILTIAGLVASFAAGRHSSRVTYEASTRASKIQLRFELKMYERAEEYRIRFVRSPDESERDRLQHVLWHTQFADAEQLRGMVNQWIQER